MNDPPSPAVPSLLEVGTRLGATVSKSVARDGGVAMGAGEIPLEAEGRSATRVAERVLLDRCRRGDPEAFARLVALHEGMVFNLAARLLGNAEDARDVAQDVFLLTYRRLGQFEGRSSLRTWLYRVTVNQAYNRRRWWRRRRREREQPLEDLATGRAAPRLADDRPSANPFEVARRRERARRVQEGLLGLSFPHRAVLVLREIEGLSCEQIAGALGVAEGTVKSRLSRARAALRERLADLVEEADRT
jgi:RNA polymerase sigma-70 factor (ECF subfamily)